MKKITIFTPTYNRKEKLENCYNSLLNQTDKRFIWLLIDDGSTDETKSWINKIKKNSQIEIKYYYQENGGKHRAYNSAIKKCNTDYFLILDSDDIISNNCIETLYEKISIIDNNPKISGIIGNKFNINDKKCIGTRVPKNIKYVTGLELYQKHKFKGDTLRFYKTEILKMFLFPEIPNEKFIYENVVFDKIDKEYKMLLIDEELYYCEYNLDGYTNNSKKIKLLNPIGYSLSLKSAAETAINYRKKINWSLLYLIWCRKFNIKQTPTSFKNKFIYIILTPFSKILEILKIPKFFFQLFK